MTFYQREDLVDFPCAPSWIEHYAEQGMTPGYPPEFYQKPSTQIIVDVSEELEKDITFLKGQNLYLLNRIQEVENSIPLKNKKGYSYE